MPSSSSSSSSASAVSSTSSSASSSSSSSSQQHHHPMPYRPPMPSEMVSIVSPSPSPPSPVLASSYSSYVPFQPQLSAFLAPVLPSTLWTAPPSAPPSAPPFAPPSAPSAPVAHAAGPSPAAPRVATSPVPPPPRTTTPSASPLSPAPSSSRTPPPRTSAISSLLQTVHSTANHAVTAIQDGTALRRLRQVASQTSEVLGALTHHPSSSSSSSSRTGSLSASSAENAAPSVSARASSDWNALPRSMQRLVAQLEDEARDEADEMRDERTIVFHVDRYFDCIDDDLLHAHAVGSSSSKLPVALCHRICTMLNYADVTRCVRTSKAWHRFGERVRSERAFVHACARSGFGYDMTGEQRGKIWQHLCGIDVLFTPSADGTPSQTSYQALLEAASTNGQCVDVDTILRDLPRTQVHLYAFLNERDATTALKNVLTAYAISDRDLGYTQGMNFVAAYLLTKMPEEEAYWMLHMLMASTPFNLRRLLEPGFAGLAVCKYQFEQLFRWFLPELHQHFELNDVFSDLLTKWFITLFTFPGFPLDALDRVWDLLMVDHFRMIHRTALAILKLSQETLLLLDFEGIMEYIRVLPDEGIFQPELLIRTALAFPISSHMMQALEVEYEAERSEKKQEATRQ